LSPKEKILQHGAQPNADDKNETVAGKIHASEVRVTETENASSSREHCGCPNEG